MKKEFTSIDAKNEAQKLVFAPLFFQAIVTLRQTGILELIGKNKKGIHIDEIASKSDISDYGIRVLLEAASSSNVVEFIDDDTVVLTKMGYILNTDLMTEVNINFVNDICYSGAKYLTESIKTGKPAGLKTLGSWNTLYEGLSILPEKEKKSWFDFDHYYSDDAFPAALKIVFKENPEYIFDIGGNTGKWAIACCEHNKNVKVKILDLPGQLGISKKNAEEKQLLSRIDFHQINLLDTSHTIPEGADAIWMSQFLDCFSEKEILTILINARNAASPGTFIYIMEPFIDNQRFEAARHCLVATSLYFTIIANGNSKMYSVAVMKKLVQDAGLKVVETFPLINDSCQTILKCTKA